MADQEAGSGGAVGAVGDVNNEVIYQGQSFEPLPSDRPDLDDPNYNNSDSNPNGIKPLRPFFPRKFEGPKEKARFFHNFPRMGHTNDITALVSFRNNKGGVASLLSDEYETLLENETVDRFGNASNAIGNFNSSFDQANLGNIDLSNVDSSVISNNAISNLSSKSYDSEQANDYIRGVACVGIIILCLYILWGLVLVLLRLGRMDCCFRRCCSYRAGDGKEKSPQSTEHEVDGMYEEGDCQENEERGCCCVTCYDSIVAKGGCLARHIFCGWLAGRPPKLPTEESLRKEKELREMSLSRLGIQSVKSGVDVAMSGVQKGACVVKSGALARKDNAANDKEKEENSVASRSLCTGILSDDKLDENGEEKESTVVALAETAVIADEESVGGKSERGDSVAISSNSAITEEYLHYRQQSVMKTMFRIRVLFLFSSIVVLTFSIILLVQSHKGLNNIVYQSKASLSLLEGHLERMTDGVEGYLERSKEVRERRDEFVNKIMEGPTDTGRGLDIVPWCPASNGTIDIEINLGKFLTRGKLIKLAFVENVSAAAGDASDWVEGQFVTVVTFLDILNERLGERDILGRILSLASSVNTLGIGEEPDDDFSIESTGEGDDRHFQSMVMKLKAIVKKLVVRVASEVSGTIDGIEFSSQESQESMNIAFEESVIKKNGQMYTVLSLKEDIDLNAIDFGVEFRGFNLTLLFATPITIRLDLSFLQQSIIEKLTSSISTVDGSLDTASDFFRPKFESLHRGLMKVSSQTESAQNSLDSILPYYYVVVAFVSIIIGLTLLFSTGVALAWREQHIDRDSGRPKLMRIFKCCQDGCLLPFFVLCGLLMWIFTTVFLTLGVVSGDFCVDSPDVQLNKILEQTLGNNDGSLEVDEGIAYNFAYYYFNGCPADVQPTLIPAAHSVITASQQVVGDFFELVSNLGSGPLGDVCGISTSTDGDDGGLNAIELLEGLAYVLRENLNAASRAIYSIAELVLCRTFHPLYSSLTYDIVCTEFMNLTGPMFVSMLFISLGSMAMVTLRVAWHEVVDEESGTETSGCCQEETDEKDCKKKENEYE